MKAIDIMKKYNITRKTLYNWVSKNKIPYTKSPSGRYDYEPINTDKPNDKLNIIYARVSTN